MTFDIPWFALFGGMLLGLSATLLLLANGRIAGISGVFSGFLRPKKNDWLWRLLFIVGLVIAGVVAVPLGVSFPAYEQNYPMVLIAGLLVGLGTKIGNGCTSGHGICGMGRLSKRSIVATLVFMAVAITTVYIRFHLI